MPPADAPPLIEDEDDTEEAEEPEPTAAAEEEEEGVAPPRSVAPEDSAFANDDDEAAALLLLLPVVALFVARDGKMAAHGGNTAPSSFGRMGGTCRLENDVPSLARALSRAKPTPSVVYSL